MNTYSENIIQAIKERIELLKYIQGETGQTAERRGANTYGFKVCPICNKGDHFTINSKSNYFNTWGACSVDGGSVIDFEMAYYNRTEAEAIKALEEYLGLNNSPTNRKKTDEIAKENYSSLIAEWKKNSGQTDYFTRRGLTEKTINKYKLGYNAEGHTSYGKAFKYIIPVTENYIILREEGNENGRYRNAGQAEILNRQYITDSSINNIFIVEGAFDALSIEELGHDAIALNSTSNANKLIELIHEHKDKLNNKEFILIPDNDEAGQKVQAKLETAFKELGLSLTVKKIPDEMGKDANEYLLKDEVSFNTFLNGAINEYKSQYVSAYLEIFLNTIMDTNKKIKPISTGYLKLNNILGGGLYEGLYAIGGISSLGKTSIVLQIADYIAKNGTDVIFFSLEMSKLELVAKSLSRQLFQSVKEKGKIKGIGTREILNGEIMDILPEMVTATEEYNETAKRLIIHEGNFDTGIDEIRTMVNKHITKTGNKPVVIIDYLQILKGKERFTEKQNADYLVSELKRITREYKIPVIAISSFNRASYGSPVSFESFKESGGIEYGADVLMGLQLSLVKELDLEKNKQANKAKLDQAKKESPRKIDLVILKNRNGEPNANIEFYFYAKNNCFVQA